MPLPKAASLTSPAARTSLFYSSLLMSVAIANPFLPIWLTAEGLTPGEIGIINATPIFLMIAINLLVGRIADRAADWRSVIIVGSILAAIPPFLLLVSEGFWPILLVWTLLNLPFHAIVPVVDAATIRMARRTGVDYGRIRVWGTLGFIAVTLLSGFVLDAWGIAAFVPFFIAVSLLRAALSLQLPLFRDRSATPVAEAAPAGPKIAVRAAELWRPWFLFTLIGGALLQASQMMLMGFGALIWADAGIDGWVVGILWAIAPASEIVAMLYFGQLSRWFGARQLILIGCGCAVLRWCCLALQPDVPIIAVLQLLHLATTGFLIMGMTSFIANWTSDAIAAEAQSFFVVIRQVATVAALIGFGFLAGSMGAAAYFVAAGVAAAGGVMIVLSLRMMSTRSEAAGLR